MKAYDLKKIVILRARQRVIVSEVYLSKKYRPDLVGFNEKTRRTFCFEIKVNKQDLKRDKKFYKYYYFVNYTYLFVVPELKELAIKKTKNTKIGVAVATKKGGLVVIKKAMLNKKPFLTFNEIKEKCLMLVYKRYTNIFLEGKGERSGLAKSGGRVFKNT